MEHRNRVRWACRRGMLELDWFLIRFFDAAYDTLSAETKKLFSELLQSEDVELHSWLTGQSEAPVPFQALIHTIQSACRALELSALS